MSISFDFGILLSILASVLTGGIAWGLQRGNIANNKQRIMELEEWKKEHQVEYLQAVQNHVLHEDFEEHVRKHEELERSMREFVTHMDLMEYQRHVATAIADLNDTRRDLKAITVSVVGMSGRNGLTGELREAISKLDNLLENRPWHIAMSRYTEARASMEMDLSSRLKWCEERLRTLEGK